MELFVGIDWGCRTHAVCVVDGSGQKLLETEVEHGGDAVLAFLESLKSLAKGDLACVRAAMESPHGVMVEALLDRGVQAFSVNPKQLDRFRDRHSGAGAKDDDLDAYVLATSLRTDRTLFRKIEVPSAQMLKLRALSRTHETIRDNVLSLANQIREELVRYYPQMAQLGDWHRERWLWDMFEAAPTPALTAPPRPREGIPGLSAQKVGALLKEHRIRRHDPKLVLQKLRATPLPVANGVADAAAARVTMLLPMLRAADRQLRDCSKQMSELLEGLSNPVDAHASAPSSKSASNEADSPEKMHHDAALLLSLPGIGVHNGAVMLTEGLSALRHRDYQALRRLAGVAPVSQRTGGRRQKPLVVQRQACNRRLREAVYHWARVASQRDERTREHYAELRRRGHTHGRATRGVADRLLKVLLAVLQSGVRYDPNLRTPAKKAPLAA